MDDDDTLVLTGTTVTVAYGDVTVTIETAQAWTPEVVDHMLTRARRQLVAAARQLGVTETDED